MAIEVIIIDDSRDAIEVLREYLQIKGIDVIAVGYNGEDAVTLYEKHNPDVILIDVTMPYYDGFYALKNIRKINPDAKIVMVTAYENHILNSKIFELKADAITVKPYDIDDVIDVLERVTNKTVSSTSLG